MRLSELDYDLPQGLIAQEPLEHRDQARMLVVERSGCTFKHSRFYKLPHCLADGDLLVLNDTRVFPARLQAQKESGGRVELLLVRSVEDPPGGWVALSRTHRPIKEGSRLLLEDGRALRVAAYARAGRPIVVSDGPEPIDRILLELGALALPHYIRREVRPADFDSYQTVYSAHPGAIAAPTAGLHFTARLLAELASSGVRSAALTLHVGPGTFSPLRSATVESHSMEAEWYTIPEATVAAIEQALRLGGRVVAVGTSTVRALESFAITGEAFGFTGLFICPGFQFKLVDAMITNFHMPRTTVLALVMALAGRDCVLAAYREAIRRRYRFLSYGDAMLIL